MLEVKLDHNAVGLIGGCSDPALLDQPYKSLLIRAGGYTRKSKSRNKGQTPREVLDWIQRIGTGTLDPKHVNNEDYAAIVESNGVAEAKFWF